MATLLTKFRINYSDVIAVPDVTKKAEASTKEEFQSAIAGANIGLAELNQEKERTNRHLRWVGWVDRRKRRRRGMCPPCVGREIHGVVCM